MPDRFSCVYAEQLESEFINKVDLNLVYQYFDIEFERLLNALARDSYSSDSPGLSLTTNRRSNPDVSPTLPDTTNVLPTISARIVCSELLNPQTSRVYLLDKGGENILNPELAPKQYTAEPNPAIPLAYSWTQKGAK